MNWPAEEQHCNALLHGREQLGLRNLQDPLPAVRTHDAAAETFVGTGTVLTFGTGPPTGPRSGASGATLLASSRTAPPSAPLSSPSDDTPFRN